MNLIEMRTARGQAIEQARTLYDRVTNEGRTLDEAENREWSQWMDKADSLANQIDQAERMDEATRSLEASTGRLSRDTVTTGQYDQELRSWLLGEQGGREFTINFGANAIRPGEDMRSWSQRNQSTGTGAAGGYTVAPEFMHELETALLSYGGARQAARVIRTSTGADLPWPTINDTGNEGRQLAEHAEAVKLDVTFGSVNIGAYKYTSDLVMVSSELLQDSAISLATEVGSALGNRIGRATNRVFTLGTGVGQPHGIVTGASLGVTGSLVDNITYNELVDMEHSVNSAYRRGAKFVFSDAMLRQIKKIKDNDGRPIWMAGLTAGAPDRVLGYEYAINDDILAPAAGAKSMLFGDVSKFIIRDVRDIVLRRLDERYAEFDAVGFVAFYRGSSRLIDGGTGPVKFFQQAAV
jgi:HK97 family phage major capsid protein